MIGHTLGFYLAKDFLRNVLMIFVLFLVLIIVVDMIELSRDLGDSLQVTFSSLLLIGLFRAPAFAENILPFAVLFGAITSLMLLNRRLELVVARASGVSVWQFLMPLVISAALVGAFSSFIYNPLSLSSLSASRAVEAAVFGKVKGAFSNKSKNFWVRLGQEDGDVVVRARVSQANGTILTAVSAYRFDSEGTLKDRLDADSATFRQGDDGTTYYEFENATLIKAGEQPVSQPRVDLPVKISRSQLESEQTTSESVGFWNLREQYQLAQQSGRNALPFATQFQSLLAQPLLFVAMVLLAGTVSLTFARFGMNGKVVLGGVAAGFVLYIATKLVITFGSNGLVPPIIAAWTPALIATLISTTVLLHQEDG